MIPTTKATIKNTITVNNKIYKAGEKFWTYNIQSFVNRKDKKGEIMIYTLYVGMNGTVQFCSCADFNLNHNPFCKHMKKLQAEINQKKEMQKKMAEQKKQAVQAAEQILKDVRKEEEQKKEEEKKRETFPLTPNTNFSLLK